MLDFSQQTFENILLRQLNKVALEIDKREGSIIRTALAPEAWYLAGVYRNLNLLQYNAFALTATGRALDYKAAERGLTRKPSTARIVNVTADAAVQQGQRLSTIDGALSVAYVALEDFAEVESGVWAGKMECTAEGAVYNQYTGLMSAIDVIPGFTSATLVDSVENGADTETDEALRARYLLSLKEAPFGGNIASYRQTILDREEFRVNGVQVWPHWDKNTQADRAGYVLVSVIGENEEDDQGGYGPVSPEKVEEIQNFVCPVVDGDLTDEGLGLAPVGAMVTVETAETVDIDFAVDVVLATGATVSDVQAGVEAAIKGVLLDIRKQWGLPEAQRNVYRQIVFKSYFYGPIQKVEGIDAIRSITMSASGYVEEDGGITIDQTAASHPVPVMGAVTITDGE